MAQQRLFKSTFVHNRTKGNIGENIACKFIESRYYKVICRNYQKKYGELDIIALKDGVLNFFEVKSVMRPFVIDRGEAHSPEENVDGWKISRIRRTITCYLDETGKGIDTEFRFHVLCVFIDTPRKIGRVKWIKDVVL